MDETSDICSRHFNIQIREAADLEKIRMPKVAHDETATAIGYEAMCEVYEGILPVRKVGQTHIWFTPWDYLIRWWASRSDAGSCGASLNWCMTAVDAW